MRRDGVSCVGQSVLQKLNAVTQSVSVFYHQSDIGEHQSENGVGLFQRDMGSVCWRDRSHPGGSGQRPLGVADVTLATHSGTG